MTSGTGVALSLSDCFLPPAINATISPTIVNTVTEVVADAKVTVFNTLKVTVYAVPVDKEKGGSLNILESIEVETNESWSASFTETDQIYSKYRNDISPLHCTVEAVPVNSKESYICTVRKVSPRINTEGINVLITAIVKLPCPHAPKKLHSVVFTT